MSIKGENFKIMVGGQVIGTARSGMLTYLDTVEKVEEPKHEEFNKVWNYRRKHSTILNDAEIVITKQDQETLTATITKAMEKDAPCARVSGEDFKRALDRYASRQSRHN